MRSKKVAIMLWLTMISLLTILVVVLMDDTVLAATGEPDTLSFFEERVSIQDDGSALVRISTVLPANQGEILKLPFAFEGSENHVVRHGPVQLDGPTVMDRGHRMLGLRSASGAVAGDSLVIEATVPGFFDPETAALEYGEFALGRNYINTSELVLKNFRLSVLLPEGMLVHEVRKVVPSYNPKKNPQPPFSVSREGQRGRADLNVAELPPAAAVSMDLSIRPLKRNLLPLIIGLVIASLYLVFFRDVLKAKKEN